MVSPSSISGGRARRRYRGRARAGDSGAPRRVVRAELYASGVGNATIASTLNAEGAPAPRTWKDPTCVWSAGSVRELVNRPLYRGEIVYGRTKKRNIEGKVEPTKRAPSDWIRVQAPELRILSPELSDAVAARIESMRARSLHGANGLLRGRPAGEGSPYVLVGLMRCGVCGGSMEVVSSKSGARRAFAYRCYRSRRQGASVCSNRLPIRMTDADDAVLGTVEKTLMNPAVVERALALAEAELIDDGAARRRAPLVVDLAALDAGVERLTTAIKRGGDLDPLLAALRESEARRGELRQQIAALDAAPRTTPLDADRGPREAAELRRATTGSCSAGTCRRRSRSSGDSSSGSSRSRRS